MENIEDLNLYRYKTNFETCLKLVEEAYSSSKEGDICLVTIQLQEILETFDRGECCSKEERPADNILMFTR